MSVVLRCPTCGTTRATPGECEACHEARVRYFCTNHTPGVWVDAPSCPQCGARFGEARRAPTPAPPMRTPSPAPPRAPASPPAPRPWADPPRARYEPEIRESLPPSRDERIAPAASPLAILLNILNAAGRSRRTPVPDRPRRAPGRGPLGCVLKVVVLFFSFVSALFLFGS